MFLNGFVKIALPNKGVLKAPAWGLFQSLDFFVPPDEKTYFSDSRDGSFSFLFARARDIPLYVECGAVDLGVTGSDVVAEAGSEVIEVLRLPFGFCRLVYAVPKNAFREVRRIATSFPRLARKYVSLKGFSAEIVELNGAVECSVAAGISDAVIDLTSSGKSLERNGLVEVDEIMSASAVLIANKNSLYEKATVIQRVVEGIKRVV